jgi:putative ubiquitin-RnfH superfamily antitoxin RatB of RatAB toxin-antitoxin module
MNLHIDVCYGLPGGKSFLARVDLRDGATVREAIEASGVLRAHPDIDLATQKVGVFGKLQPLDAALADFDRVEIYRPLKVDPKTARQRRVDKARKAGSIEGRKWQSKDSR